MDVVVLIALVFYAFIVVGSYYPKLLYAIWCVITGSKEGIRDCGSLCDDELDRYGPKAFDRWQAEQRWRQENYLPYDNTRWLDDREKRR